MFGIQIPTVFKNLTEWSSICTNIKTSLQQQKNKLFSSLPTFIWDNKEG